MKIEISKNNYKIMPPTDCFAVKQGGGSTFKSKKMILTTDQTRKTLKFKQNKRKSNSKTFFFQ